MDPTHPKPQSNNNMPTITITEPDPTSTPPLVRTQNPLSESYTFYQNYLTSGYRQEIGPFTFYPDPELEIAIFGFPVDEFGQKLANDLRKSQRLLEPLQERAAQWERHLRSNPSASKKFYVEEIRPEYAKRMEEMEDLATAIEMAREAVEKRFRLWVQAEELMGETLGALEEMMGVIDGLPEDEKLRRTGG